MRNWSFHENMENKEKLLAECDNDSDNAYDNTMCDEVAVVEVYTNQENADDLTTEDKSYILNKFLSTKAITNQPVAKRRARDLRSIVSIESNATYDIPIQKNLLEQNGNVEEDTTTITKYENEKSDGKDDSKKKLSFEENEKICENVDEETNGKDYILGIRVLKTDCLLLNSCVLQPMIRIFLVDSETGEFVKKSDPRRNVMIGKEESSTIDYISAFETKPCNFYQNRRIIPHWNETIFVNDDFSYISQMERLLILFELIESSTLTEAKYIAWAFLKPQQNYEQPLRLQLYHPHHTNTKKNDSPSVAFKWWKKNRRRKYPSTLYVSLKKTNVPEKTIKLWNSKTHNERDTVENEEDNKKLEETSEELRIQDVPKSSRLENRICQFANEKLFDVPLKEGAMILRFSNNCEYLAIAASDDGNVYNILIYSVISEEEVFRFESHHGFIYDITWTSSDKKLLSASADGTAIVWDVCLRKIDSVLAHPTFVYCVACSKDRIATGGYDKKLRIWELSSNYSLLEELPEHKGYITSVCFNKEGYFLYSADSVGAIRMWQREQANWLLKQEIKVAELENIIINEVILHKRERRLIVQSRDGFLRLTDIKTGYVLQTYAKGSKEKLITRCALTPCGTYLLGGNLKGELFIWMVDNGRLEQVRTPFQAKIPIHCVQYHPKHSLIAVSHYGHNVPVVVYGVKDASGIKEEKKVMKVTKSNFAKVCQQGASFRLILDKLDNITILK